MTNKELRKRARAEGARMCNCSGCKIYGAESGTRPPECFAFEYADGFRDGYVRAIEEATKTVRALHADTAELLDLEEAHS